MSVRPVASTSVTATTTTVKSTVVQTITATPSKSLPPFVKITPTSSSEPPSPAPPPTDDEPPPAPSPTPDPTFISQDFSPTPPPDLPATSSSVPFLEESPTFSNVFIPDTTDVAPSASGIAVSTMTIVSASTDSTSGVHTYTRVTTIASFESLPTQKSGRDTRSTDGSSSPNIGVIIMIVMGSLVACAIALLGLYWCRLRKRNRHGYGDSSGASTWVRMFNWAPTHERLGSGSQSPGRRSAASSSWGTTPTPFYGYRDAEASVEVLSPTTPRIHFAEPSRNSSDLEARVRPRDKGRPVQRDRPPTYYTTSTNTTVATALPQYSACDPSSSVSEGSGPPSLRLLTIPLSAREKTRRSPPSSHPLTPIGERF